MSAVRPLVYSLAICSLILAPLVAFADLGPPRPRPRPTEPKPEVKAAGAPLEIVLQDGGKPLRLEIPRGLLPKDATAVRGGFFGGFGEFRTIVAGLALSLAVVVAGLWLVRRFAVSASRPLPKAATVATVVTLVVAGLAVTTAWADLLPFGNRPRPPRADAALKLQIEVVEGGDSMVLYGTAADLAKISAAVRGARPAPGATGSAPPTSSER